MASFAPSEEPKSSAVTISRQAPAGIRLLVPPGREDFDSAADDAGKGGAPGREGRLLGIRSDSSIIGRHRGVNGQCRQQDDRSGFDTRLEINSGYDENRFLHSGGGAGR